MRGEYSAFESLYKRYIKEIIYHARNLLTSSEEAEDAAQEVIIALYHNIKGLRSPYAFKSYLLKTIYTVCAARNRSTKQPSEQIEDYEELIEDTTELGPQGSLEQMELSQAIREVLVELPPRQREALSLRYFDDLGYEEIAQLLNVSVSTAGTNILRAKRTLKSLIEKGGIMDSQRQGREIPNENKAETMDIPTIEGAKAIGDSEDTQTIKGAAAAPAIYVAVAQLIEDSVDTESIERVTKGVTLVLTGSGAAVGFNVGMGIKTKLLAAAFSVIIAASGIVVAYGAYRAYVTDTVLETSTSRGVEESLAGEFIPDAQIVFSGGNIASDTNDGMIEHINPASASLALDEGEALEWKIADRSDVILAQGEGALVSEDVFAELPLGTYTLGWLAVNDEGSKATITRDFAIA